MHFDQCSVQPSTLNLPNVNCQQSFSYPMLACDHGAAKMDPPAVNGQLGCQRCDGAFPFYISTPTRNSNPQCEPSKVQTPPRRSDRPPASERTHFRSPSPGGLPRVRGRRGWSSRSLTSRRAHAASPPTRASSPSP